MKVYITAFDPIGTGIFEMDVDESQIIENGDLEYNCQIEHTYRCYKKDWHYTKEDAIIRMNVNRKRAIINAKKQIEKIEHRINLLRSVTF